MKNNRKIRKWVLQNKWVIGGFLLPFALECIIVGIAFFFLHMGVVASDCFEQYIPFFSVYYDKLKEGSSIFYSWNGSMGFDFWNVFCYYLVSPFNLLILLFPKSCIIYVVNFLILFKTALCGGTFSWYLQKKVIGGNDKKQGNWFISLFGLLFAFSGFLLGYAWNVMWLDSIVLFPLLMSAMDDLIQKKKGNCYCLILAATILVNYFMGYLICIYIFLSFFTYEWKGWKNFFESFVRIGVYSVLGVGISAIVLLPSFLGLTNTAISSESLPEVSLYGNFGTVLSTLGSFSLPIGISFDRERANLYIGEFALLLVFIYLTCNKIRRREKIQKLILIGILIFSCNFKPLNFVWHGFHEQSGIPNRFSFIIIFLMLEMAYEAWIRRIEISQKEMKIALSGYCISMIVIMILGIVAGEAWYLFILNIIIGLLYGRWFFRHRQTLLHIKRLQFFIITETIIMYIIAMFNCLGTIMSSYGEQIPDFDRLSEHIEESAYREKMDATTNLVELQWEELIQNLQLEEISVDFVEQVYELLTNIGHLSIMNEASVYGLHSMTLFNTFNNSNLSEFYKMTGGEGSSNYVGYFGENSFMDMLLGVKYYYNRDRIVNSFAYTLVDTTGNVDLYENQYALSLAYAIPYTLWREKTLLFSNPFQTMNQISKHVVGENVYSTRQFTLQEVNGCTIEKFTGTYGYFVEFVRGEAKITLSYKAKEEENLVLQLCNQEMYLAEIFVNEKSIVKGELHREIVDLGILQPEDEVKVILTFSKGYDKAGMYLYAAALKQDVMVDVYESLVDEQMNVTSFEEDCITGTIHILENETNDTTPVLITIPYKNGWNFYVDGESVEVDTENLWGGAFPILELTSGEHEIVCSYETPMFYIGLWVSIVSLILYVIQYATQRKMEKY